MMKERLFNELAAFAAAVLTTVFAVMASELAKSLISRGYRQKGAKQALRELVENVGRDLIGRAEKIFGAGTGKYKMSYVVRNLLTYLPDRYGDFVGADEVQRAAEELFERMKAEKKQGKSVPLKSFAEPPVITSEAKDRRGAKE